MSVFKGGVPYGVDVNRLKEKWPPGELVEGLVIPHSDISKVIDVEAGSSRYYGVVNSWIGYLKSGCGIVAVMEPKVGVRVLDPAGVLDHAEKRTRQKIRQTGRVVKLFGLVQRTRLDSTGQGRLDHMLRVVGALRTAIQSTAKEMAIDLAPVKSLPKPAKPSAPSEPTTTATK